MKQITKYLLAVLIIVPFFSFAQVVPVKQLQKGASNGQILKMKAGVPAWEDPTEINIVSLGGLGNWNGTTGTDNLTAINTAIANAASGQKIYIPSGNYYFSGNIELPSTKDVYLLSDGNLYFPANAGINIENAWANKITIQVNGTIYGPNTGTAYDSFAAGIAVRISNSYNNEFRFNTIRGFGTAAIQIGGKGSVFNGSQYNRITFNNLHRNKVGLLLKSEGSAALWCNENMFTGGKITGKEGIVSEKIAAQSDKFNGNKFYNIGFETMTGHAINMEYAKFNTFYSPRTVLGENPAVASGLITLGDSTENNTIYGGSIYQSGYVDLGIQNNFYGLVFTASGIPMASQAFGLTSTNHRGVYVGGNISNTGLNEFSGDLFVFGNTRISARYAATAKINGIEKQLPYEKAYQNADTNTSLQLTENIGLVRANPSSNATYYLKSVDQPNSLYPNIIVVQNLSVNTITVKSAVDSSSLATVSGSGIFNIVNTQGAYRVYKISQVGSDPFTNNGNAFGSASTIGNTDNFDFKIITNNTERGRFYGGGNFALYNGGVWRNSAALANSYIDMSLTGAQVWRGIADGNPALQINQNHASSTGALIDARLAGLQKFIVSYLGVTTAAQYRLWDMDTAPPTATSTGTKGEIRFTTTGIYICTATNTWIKAVAATF